MKSCIWLTMIASTVLCGCSRNPPDVPVTFVPDDDPIMNAAIEKAKASVGDFIAALQNPKAGQSSFSIKMQFADGKNREQMWLSPVRYDGQNFQGTVNNVPKELKNVRLGDSISVDPKMITDWMYVENQKLVGGFSIRVLHDRGTLKERADFDKSVPFIID